MVNRLSKRKVYRYLKALIESYLEDYPNYYDYVEQREWELANPVAQLDENVGGGKAKYNYDNPVDRLLMKIEDDKYLKSIGRIHDGIRVCYEEADPIVQTICNELYFTKPKVRKYRNINELVDSGAIHVSSSVAYSKWDGFISECMVQLDMDQYNIIY